MRMRIEAWFRFVAETICNRAWLLLVITGLATGFLVYQLPGLRVDTSTESFFHKDDPVLEEYEAFKDQFGWDELIVLAIEPPEVFDKDFLERLKELHADLEDNVPHLADITSMVNARNTRGEEDKLIVEDLLENFPENASEMADLKKRVMANPLYINRIISSDGGMTTIILETDLSAVTSNKIDALSGFEESEAIEPSLEEKNISKNDIAEAVVSAVEKIVNKYQSPDFRIHLAGAPVVLKKHKEAMIGDMGKFMLLAIATIALCLYLMFHRITGVLLPLLVVVLSLLSTLGMMGLFGVAFTVPNMILPSFLLAVGVGASVHILSLIYRHYEQNNNKREAIVYAMGHSGLAVVMTSLTTAVGVASFATTEMAPVAYLGIFGGAGVLFSLIYTIVLLPTLLFLLPLKVRFVNKRGGPALQDRFGRFLDWVSDMSTGYPKTITAITVALLVVGLASAMQLRFSHDTLKWLHPSWPCRQATEKIDEVLGGTITLEVLVDTGRENGLYDPYILKSLDELAEEFDKFDDGLIKVAKASSIADILKEIHQALNENRPEFYTVPENGDLIPQEFLLFENSGSDDLEKVTDSAFRVGRFSVLVPWVDVFRYVPLVNKIEHDFQEKLGTKATISTTGILRLFIHTVTAASKSMAEGYVSAVILITIMMILMVGKIRLGLLAMIPNLSPVVLVIGLMHWLRLPLDTYTMMIGTIALGLSVDDTVHFMNGFRKYYDETGDVKVAINKTLHTSGRAMLVTSIVLTIGFLAFTCASMRNVVNFGWLTGLTIMLALVADFFSVPAILTLMNRTTQMKVE